MILADRASKVKVSRELPLVSEVAPEANAIGPLMTIQHERIYLKWAWSAH